MGEAPTGRVSRLFLAGPDCMAVPLEPCPGCPCMGRNCPNQVQLLSKISKLPAAGGVLMLLGLKSGGFALVDKVNWFFKLGDEDIPLPGAGDGRGPVSRTWRRSPHPEARCACTEQRSDSRHVPSAYSTAHQHSPSCWPSLPMARAGQKLLCAGNLRACVGTRSSLSRGTGLKVSE